MQTSVEFSSKISPETRKEQLINAVVDAAKQLKIAEKQGNKETIQSATETIRRLYREIIGMSEDENPDAIVVVDAGVTLKKVRKADLASKEEETRSQYDVPTSYADGLNAAEPLSSNKYKRYRVKKTSPRNGYMIGSTGGKPRAIAGAELAKYFDAKIVNTSRYPIPQESPTEKLPEENHYAVYGDYEKALGIDPERIIAEPDSTNTLEMLIQMVKMAKDNNWNNVIMITNDYHKRVPAFWKALSNKKSAEKQLAYSFGLLDLLSQDTRNNDAKLNKENAAKTIFKDAIGYSVHYRGDGEPTIHFDEQNDFFDIAQKLKMHIIAAEDILPARNEKYETIVQNARNTNGYQQLIQGEEKGVAQIIGGTYNKAAYEAEYKKNAPIDKSF